MRGESRLDRDVLHDDVLHLKDVKLIGCKTEGQATSGEVLTGAHPGRTDADELTVFKSLGLGVEDLAAAELVVRKAREQGVGTEVEF